MRPDNQRLVAPSMRQFSLRDLAAAAIADLAQRSGEPLPPELRALVENLRPPSLPDGSWARLVEESRADEDLALRTLASSLQLTPLELMALALLAALEEDPLLGRAVAALQAPLGGSRPTLALLSVLFAPLARSSLPIQELISGNSLASKLVTLDGEGRPLPERAPLLSPALYLALRGRDAAWPSAVIGLGAFPAVRLPPSMLADARSQAQALQQGERHLVLRTGSPSEGRSVACAIAESLQRRAVFLAEEASPGLGPWLSLRGLLPVFCLELDPGDRKQLPTIPFYDGPVLALAGAEGAILVAGAGANTWTLGVPPRAEREQLWRAALADDPAAVEFARTHRHAAGRIAHLGRVLRQRSLLAQGGGMLAPDLRSAAWTSEGSGLAGLAEALTDPIPDHALVVEPGLRESLEHLLLRCRMREGLADDLGVAMSARYRPGVRALFVGPSGTGKTLAAGWLACRLGLPLYRVDLASVTSKYIGETEKNLALLLARAEYAEVVLLFDEADSLFGKRTDVKESNDRFANAQTNYLLQRIESFDGIVLLTSNSRARFDSAFSRRLDAILEFTKPGPDQRRALWGEHLGEGHGLSPRALNRLAALVDFAGGEIRNVVLAAAVLARSQQRAIEFADVVVGLTAEFKKLGKQLPLELRREA